MKFLKNHTIPKVLILVSMVTSFGVLNLDPPKKYPHPATRNRFSAAKVDPVADTHSKHEATSGFDGTTEVKADPVAGWQTKFKGSSHFVNLEPLQAKLEKARAHENELGPALRVLLISA